MILSSWGCFVINLDRSPQRMANIQRQLDELGIPFERVAGIDGNQIDPDAQPQFSRAGYERRHGKEPTPCEIGCFLSHIEVMRRFLATDARFCLVLEDDANLDDSVTSVLDGLSHASGEWNMALLYGNYSGLAQPLARIDPTHQLVGYLARQTGAVAYAIDRQAARIYVRELLPMTLPLDVDFDRAWDFGIKFRGVMPFPATTGAYQSDIGVIGRKFPWYRRLGTYALRGKGELKRYYHYALTDPIWLESRRYRLTVMLRHIQASLAPAVSALIRLAHAR